MVVVVTGFAIGALLVAPAGGQLMKNADEPINFGGCVVDGQRSANGRLETVTTQNWLGTVMAGANSNALLIERRGHRFRLVAGKYEREDAGFLRSSADDAETRNG